MTMVILSQEGAAADLIFRSAFLNDGEAALCFSKSLELSLATFKRTSDEVLLNLRKKVWQSDWRGAGPARLVALQWSRPSKRNVQRVAQGEALHLRVPLVQAKCA